MTSDEDVLYHELAVVAAYYHWPLGELLDLEHATRRRFIRAIDDLDVRR